MNKIALFILLFSFQVFANPQCEEEWDLPSNEEIENLFGEYYRPTSETTEGKGIALIEYYTMPGNYYLLNRDLRSIFPAKKSIEMAKLIEQALCLASEFQGTVYRGIRTKLKYKKGQLVKFKSFLSTSKVKESAEYFGRETFYVIQSHTGRDLSTLSMCRGEKEVLFAPGRTFKITDVKENNTIHMSEIVD